MKLIRGVYSKSIMFKLGLNGQNCKKKKKKASFKAFCEFITVVIQHFKLFSLVPITS